jgi:hypothetical protein
MRRIVPPSTPRIGNTAHFMRQIHAFVVSLRSWMKARSRAGFDLPLLPS